MVIHRDHPVLAQPEHRSWVGEQRAPRFPGGGGRGVPAAYPPPPPPALRLTLLFPGAFWWVPRGESNEYDSWPLRGTRVKAWGQKPLLTP